MPLSFPQIWTEFRRRIYISASPKIIFEAWANQGDMENWCMKKAQYSRTYFAPLGLGEIIKQGDRFEWEWHTWPEFGVMTGLVAILEPEKRICFEIDDLGVLELSIIEKHNRSELILFQSGIDDTEEAKKKMFLCWSLCWSFWLVNLKAFLEHGILLNETHVTLEGNSRLEIINH